MAVGLFYNLRLMGVTQFLDMPFTSFVGMSGRLYATGPDGVYALHGDDDNAGLPIEMVVETPQIDLGGVYQVRSLTFGLEAEGSVAVDVSFDEEDPRRYILDPLNRASRQHGRTLFLSSADFGRYMRIILTNLDGCDISLDSLSAVLLARKVSSHA